MGIQTCSSRWRRRQTLFIAGLILVFSTSAAVLSKTNPVREEKAAAIERAAAVALCQSAKGYDCWRFATAPRGGQITQVKIFGERQSGARFLKQLVGLNLDVDVVSLEDDTRNLLPHEVDKLYEKDFSNSFGWRHSCAPTEEQLDKQVDHEVLQKTLFLCVAKNPYAWLLSLYGKLPRYRGSEHAADASFEDFTRTPWVALGRENIGACQPKASTRQRQQAKGLDSGFLNPVVLWNQKNRALRRLKAPYVYFVRYEDVLLDPSDFLQQLVTKFGLRRKAAFLINVLQPTTLSGARRQKQGGALAQNRTFDSFRQYYLYGGWQKRFREMTSLGWLTAPTYEKLKTVPIGALERLRFIHRWLDKDTLSLWGYALWPTDDPLGPGGAGLGAEVAAALAHPEGTLHRPSGMASQGGGVAGYAHQHHLHPRTGSNFEVHRGGEEEGGVGVVGGNSRVGGGLSGGGLQGGRLKQAQDQLRDQALSAIALGPSNNNNINRQPPSGGLLASPQGSSPVEVLETPAAPPPREQTHPCDTSNGPVRRRDRERCARRERVKQALLGVEKEVAVAAYTTSVMSTSAAGLGGATEAASRTSGNERLEGAADSGISQYVEEAALAAASRAGHFAG